ncbi:MAG: hypothetical protein V8Q83_09580 [Blautia sp.]
MEGDDPECVDSIIGGSVEFSMHIDADYDDETSLLWKFVTDIKDTLTRNKPINAAGNEAPNDSYYTDREITWDQEKQINRCVGIDSATTAVYIEIERLA